jgi:hypothetical protein
MKFWKTKAFQELKSAWDRKLKDSGFVDIEAEGKREIDLRNANVRDYEAVQAYYRAAVRYLNSGEFSKEGHREVWALHCEGLSCREIASSLGIDKSNTHRLIARYRALAGLSGQRTLRTAHARV